MVKMNAPKVLGETVWIETCVYKEIEDYRRLKGKGYFVEIKAPRFRENVELLVFPVVSAIELGDQEVPEKTRAIFIFVDMPKAFYSFVFDVPLIRMCKKEAGLNEYYDFFPGSRTLGFVRYDYFERCLRERVLIGLWRDWKDDEEEK